MTRFVIDAPTLLHLIEHEVPVSADHQLVAPNLIRSQALDLLFIAVRDGRLDEATALNRLNTVAETKMRLLGDRVSRRTAWNIARDAGWPDTADAEYLAVCRLQADAFVTIDEEMAARADGVVPIAPVSALTD